MVHILHGNLLMDCIWVIQDVACVCSEQLNHEDHELK